MDDDTKQCLIVCVMIAVVCMTFIRGCTETVVSFQQSRQKTICLEQAKQWQDGNCIR